MVVQKHIHSKFKERMDKSRMPWKPTETPNECRWWWDPQHPPPGSVGSMSSDFGYTRGPCPECQYCHSSLFIEYAMSKRKNTSKDITSSRRGRLTWPRDPSYTLGAKCWFVFFNNMNQCAARKTWSVETKGQPRLRCIQWQFFWNISVGIRSSDGSSAIVERKWRLN